MGLMDRINREPSVSERDFPEPAAGAAEAAAQTEVENIQLSEEQLALKDKIHSEVASRLARQDTPGTEEEITHIIEEAVEEFASEVARKDRARIVSEIRNEVSGYGPLEALLADPSVSEIMVNGPKQIYVERSGRLEKSQVTFRDDEHVRRIIDRIVSPLGRHIDDSTPMVDARLPNGSRVNAIIPPVSLVGPSLTIRKFSSTPLTIRNLISYNSLSQNMARFLEAAVKGRLNILVSGGTGSGKTTLLNVLSAYIPSAERIVTIEDAAELKLLQEHVVSLESRAPNLEGAGAITIRDLVRNALRMRPDRIVVGEVRGGETLDMLQAMNTGHDGSMTTAHANSPRDALLRIETMVMMSGMELPVAAIRTQVASALDIVIQQTRLRDGSRKVTSISEISGMEGDVITMQELFRFQTDGYSESGSVVGRFMATGTRPHCLDKIINNGIYVDEKWFYNSSSADF